MIDIKGSATGRIFMNGANKDMYELDYSSSTGWFGGGTKVRITNRSSGSLSDWIPTVFSSNSELNKGARLISRSRRSGVVCCRYPAAVPVYSAYERRNRNVRHIREFIYESWAVQPGHKRSTRPWVNKDRINSCCRAARVTKSRPSHYLDKR